MKHAKIYVCIEQTMLRLLQQLGCNNIYNMDWLALPHFLNWALKAANIFLGKGVMCVSYLFFLLLFLCQTCHPCIIWSIFCQIYEKYFSKKHFCTIKRFFSFLKLILEMINIYLLGLILWNINMHWRVWTILWLFTSSCKIFINFVTKRYFTTSMGTTSGRAPS